MELSLTLPGKKAGKDKVSLSDEAFGKEYNEALVHQTVVTYLAGARQGTVQQKTRSEVRGETMSCRESRPAFGNCDALRHLGSPYL